jgi:hypothetical protein
VAQIGQPLQSHLNIPIPMSITNTDKVTEVSNRW